VALKHSLALSLLPSLQSGGGRQTQELGRFLLLLLLNSSSALLKGSSQTCLRWHQNDDLGCADPSRCYSRKNKRTNWKLSPPLSLAGLIHLWRRQCLLLLDTWMMWNSRTPASLWEHSGGRLKPRRRSDWLFKLQSVSQRHAGYLTVLMFSTSTKTSVPPLPLSSTLWCGGTLLRQADACTLRERLAQMNTEWRNTRWLHMQREREMMACLVMRGKWRDFRYNWSKGNW